MKLGMLVALGVSHRHKGAGERVSDRDSGVVAKRSKGWGTEDATGE